MPEAPTFPVCLFAFDAQEIDLERRTISGGTSINGEEDVIATDGGGRWFADFMDGPLIERETVLAWRAFTALAEEGVQEIIVPFCDPMHQPYGNEHLVPHSDDSEFEDETEYEGGGPVASIAADAALRATTVSLNIAFDQELIGGEHFSIRHPTKGWRAYRVRTIVSQSATEAVVTFRPPLREAVTEGEEANFADPRCLMRVDGRPNNRLDLGNYGEAAVRFVEAP